MTPYKQEPVIDSSLCPAVPPRHQLLVLFFNLLSCHMLLPQNSSYFFHSHTAFHTVSQICAIWTIYPITQMSSKWSCYILMAPQCHSPPKIIYCPVHVHGINSCLQIPLLLAFLSLLSLLMNSNTKCKLNKPLPTQLTYS